MNDPAKFQKYRQLGFKLTPQRLAILEFLDGNTSHPSADEIYQHVAKTFPSMSFATVYNTLEALRNKGQILELSIDPSKKRFDPNPIPHNHMICTSCNKIIDIPEDYQINLDTSLCQGFQVTGYTVTFYGICPECQNRQKQADKKAAAV